MRDYVAIVDGYAAALARQAATVSACTVPLVTPLLLGLAAPTAAQQPAPITPDAFGELEWRSIGPATVGGRLTDIAGIPGDPSIFYIASASGGLFKTTNTGTTFEPIFTDQPVLSIGAIAVDPDDPAVIYVGTGEGNPRNTASFGNGVYKSVDGGETWTFLGLEDTERIARIRLHPENPDIVYVAALGHEWGANEQRGLFRSTNGGRTWEKILYVDEKTGASDVVLDPQNPEIIYAGMYDFLRRPWHLRSGGPGSDLYRSSDGGDTWENLTAQAADNGLPAGLLGRIGVAVSRSDPNVVYAMIESEAEGELWRSDDRGRSWRMVNDNPDINDRPFYFSDLRVDPADPDRVYAISGPLMVSNDGGETFEEIADGVHGDFHAMWIDPLNPERLLVGSDGGAFLSWDRAATFEFLDNEVYAQAYHVSVDMREPYYVCGGLQDNGVWCGPNEQWNTSGILNRDWYRLRGGDGYYAEIDPRDWRRIASNSHYGRIGRMNAQTGGSQAIQPYPVSLGGSAAGAHPYRFNWNSPIHRSPNNPDVVYFGSNVLFKTTDGGRTWEEISPDLTTDDPEKQRSSGGPITTDNTSAEYHTTIIAINESPIDAGVIWVGTDDGNVQVTRNGGETWTNVIENIPGVPPYSWVPAVDASDHVAGTAYVVFDRHRNNDFGPYAYKTTDYGESWTNITSNLPQLGYLHIVKDDPVKANLLYAGTELGIFVSFDQGGHWVSLRQELPPVAVRDLVVHPRDNDLIIATHGRGFMVMDDVAPLQALADAVAAGVYLFDPPLATRVERWDDYIGIAQQQFEGENPPTGALISYHLSNDAAGGEPTLEIVDESGDLVRTLDPSAEPGVNRVVWDLREQPLAQPDEAEEGEDGRDIDNTSPEVLPGSYTVRLRLGDRQLVAPLTVRLDPRLDIPRADLVAQHDAVQRLARMSFDAERAVERIDEQLEQLAERIAAASGDARAGLEQARAPLEELRDRLTTEPGGYRSPDMLADHIENLLENIDDHPGRPTEAQLTWIQRFDEALAAVLEELSQAVAAAPEP